MTVYSKASSRPSSSSSLSFCYIASDDEASIEVLLAAVTTTTSSLAASSHSSDPRVTRQIHPPTTVVLAPQPSFVPYAQLCFNQELNTISTMLVGSKTNESHAPNLTFSADSDDESGSGWSTGYSSDESDYCEDLRHRSHGVVWISREWWTSQNQDTSSNDERALLPELRLAHSNSSEESTSSFLSLKSCGKLFCHLRKSESRGYHHHASTHHHHHATKVIAGRGSKRDNDQRFYGYQLLNN